MLVFFVLGLDLVLMVGRAASGGVFLGVCELSIILGSLSANGWPQYSLNCLRLAPEAGLPK